MRSRRFAISALAAFLALGGLAYGNGLNLNSLGTRALSMGGAFVGLADDFSAVFWNPAGAAGFKMKYLGFYVTDLIGKKITSKTRESAIRERLLKALQARHDQALQPA